MKTRVVVLGAGFGGLELTIILSQECGGAIDIVLVDKATHSCSASRNST